MLRPEIVDAFRAQVPACRKAGSEFTARLLEHCLADMEAGGPLAGLLAGWSGHPVLDALPQRLLGAVQYLVLEGRAPELARHYPSLGGAPTWPAAGEAFVDVVRREAAALRPRLDLQVQTNEVRRCAALLGGFLEVARATRLPLRVREIGSSAGLLLFFDRYRYALGPHGWGDPRAAVRLEVEWRGPPPALDAPLRVASRAGCDIAPIDPTLPAELHRIECFLWADQTDRHALLRAAAAALGGERPPVETLGAVDFLTRELAERCEGVASVVFDSNMWWYLPAAEREAVRATVEAAGARADAAAPLAWLSLEPPSFDFTELRLRTWPGGRERLLARAHHHARWVEWLAQARRARSEP